MKTSLLIGLFFTCCSSLYLNAQITTPVIRANFGVDADLRANYYNGLLQSGNDDWYNNGTPGTGQFVIDTAGAAAVVAGYLSDASPWPKRMASLYRPMRVPTFTVVNNRLWLDALFVRDYHGTDTTTFSTASNKNGMSPVNWTGGVQNIPDKNDILDMYIHLRRAGPTKLDSLWMFGAISLDNTTGNRYFDFEMYQTDIYYDRVSQKFYGYGPDAGHTSWQLDAAGNITTPGDIIFSAEYQSSTLTNIEARIWVHISALSITPAQFDWSGQFDGASASATFGYASILPKNGGTFYTGLGSPGPPNLSWVGPFQLVLQDNSLATSYIKDQFMEFSVNLTKLGLDPATDLSGDVCGTPFNRVVVKTRASASFTAELKDFVAPIDLFLAPRAEVAAEFPVLCTDSSVTRIDVLNPSASSTYVWTTLNGNIVTNPPTGTSIVVDTPGTYIVTQYLNVACAPYAADTVIVNFNDSTCVLLPTELLEFRGAINNRTAQLNWKVSNNQVVQYFDLERSTDGLHFDYVDRITNTSPQIPEAAYYSTDQLGILSAEHVFYRLKITDIYGRVIYSKAIRLALINGNKRSITITPNPVNNWAQLNIEAASNSNVQVFIYNITGSRVYSMNTFVQRGNNTVLLNDLSKFGPGAYQLVVKLGSEIFFEKIIISK